MLAVSSQHLGFLSDLPIRWRFYNNAAVTSTQQSTHLTTGLMCRMPQLHSLIRSVVITHTIIVYLLDLIMIIPTVRRYRFKNDEPITIAAVWWCRRLFSWLQLGRPLTSLLSWSVDSDASLLLSTRVWLILKYGVIRIIGPTTRFVFNRLVVH